MPTIHIARQHTQQTCQGSILGRNLGDGGQQQMCGTLVIHVLLGRPRSLPKPSLFKSSNPGRKTLSCRSWGLLNSMIIGHPPIAWPEHGLGCDTRVVSQGGGTFASVLLCQQMSPQLGIKSSSPSSGSLRGLGPSGAEWQGRIAGGLPHQHFCSMKLCSSSDVMRRVVDRAVASFLGAVHVVSSSCWRPACWGPLFYPSNIINNTCI